MLGSVAAPTRRHDRGVAFDPMDAKTMDAKKRESERDPAAALPHYHGHRERFRAVGPDALSDYELLEAVLFRALPRVTSSRLPRR